MKIILYKKDNCDRCNNIINLIKKKGDEDKLEIVNLSDKDYYNKYYNKPCPIIYMNDMLYSYELFIEVFTKYYYNIE